MLDHSDDYLPEFVLGLLDEEARQSVEEHLAQCERCWARLTELGGALEPTNREQAAAPPVAEKPKKLRLALPAEPRARFSDSAEKVSTLFDLRIHRAVALLELVDDPSCWLPSSVPGAWTFPVDAGAKLDGAVTLMVRVRPGTRLMPKPNAGEEHLFVLQGAVRISSGRELSRGEYLVQPKGQVEWAEALPGEDAICCLVTARRS